MLAHVPSATERLLAGERPIRGFHEPMFSSPPAEFGDGHRLADEDSSAYVKTGLIGGQS
jgi:hypothetical protein